MKQRTIRPGQITLLIAIALVHVLTWFAYYGNLPAGQYPSDETRATLNAAQAIAGNHSQSGSSVSDNSLYIYTLSVLARFSETDAVLTAAARTLNALALLWITGVCASAASRYWQSNRAVWIVGLLVGLNPVLVFWAGEITPALLAAACMSTAFAHLLPWVKHTRISSSLIIAVSLTLASALQTALLPFALLWALFALLYPINQRSAHFSFAIVPPAVLSGLVLLTSFTLETPWQWRPDSFPHGVYLAYAALANPEIPQDKNFAFYRELHWLLFLNPVHWGALFILAGAGFYARLKESPWSPSVLITLASLLLFAFSFAVNGEGSPTRVSLVPLVTIFAAGAYQMPRFWHRANNSRRLKLLFAGLVLGVFSYGANFATDQSKARESDLVYLAEANLAMDQNRRATTWAKKALEINPGRLEMKAILVLAQFNDWALGRQPKTLPSETVREYLAAADSVQNTSTLRTIRAIYQYKLRNTEDALAAWRAEKVTCPLAALCLYWTGNTNPGSRLEPRNFPESPYRDLLRDGLLIDRNALEYTDIERKIDNLLAPAY
ncbi:MAG: hypothetical protein GVY36_00910 [Verrucomicrobia bacterium]|jgi:hypothetical protein|nr:hypothetical protein [Verrucomicrobiota bacterium]